MLNFGELNATQLEHWQRSIEVIEDNGQAQQMRLFTDRDNLAPDDPDVCQVRLSTLQARHPRQFSTCWSGCRLFEKLHLDRFYSQAQTHYRGPEDCEVMDYGRSAARLTAPVPEN